MRSVLIYALPIFYIVYFFVVLFLPTYRVWKKTGEKTFLLGNTESAHDFVGQLYRFVTVAVAVILLLYVFSETIYGYLVPIPWLQHTTLAFIGCGMLLLSLAWISLAQFHMGNSWRIGFDQEKKTEFVQRGLFRISRNPMFLGVRINFLGFFFVLPNAATLVILVLGDVLLQIQVRMEEEYLTKQHGELYEQYTQKTARWLLF